MSAPGELPNNPKPVVKDKNPHNYRKVGYCMIIIAVSLVIIAVLSWGLANDYHFSSNIMALQEVDSMTPKSGYNIVIFDISQPVGAKLKMLDHADTLDDALALQTQDAQQNQGNTIQVLLFNGSKDYNLNLMKDAEVYVQTPKSGYNIVLDSYPLAVGAQLAVASHDGSFDNATADQTVQENNIQGQEVKVLIFSPNYIDNLKTAEGTSTPVGAYALLANQTSAASNMTQATNQTTTNATSSNSTSQIPLVTNQTSVAATNKTTTANATASITINSTSAVSANKSATVQANQTTIMTNMTAKAANQTSAMTSNTTSTTNQTGTASSNQTATVPKSVQSNTTLPASGANATSTSTAQSSTTVTISKGASATQGTCTATDCFDPQVINIQVGNTITWTNDDTVGHTATSGKVTDNQTGTVWDSSLIKAGGTYTSPPFTTAGTYNYFCQVHPWMTGQVIVGGAAPSQTSTNGTGTTKTVNLNETMIVNGTSK